MEHLTKQQIVLLTLFVSFVTSIATGIVTVSLMDQAPVGVTQTIDRIVERTIETVSPGNEVASVGEKIFVNFEDQTSIATERVSQSLVRIKPRLGGSESVTGLGVIVSKEGVIVTDKSAVPSLGDAVAVFPDGKEFPIQTIQAQIEGDIIFVLALVPSNEKNILKISPISLAPSIKLGQTIFAISGTDSNTLLQGIVSKVEGNVGTTTVVNSVITNLDSGNILVGSPSFNLGGEVVGIKTSSLTSESGVAFYPLSLIKSTIPVLSR